MGAISKEHFVSLGLLKLSQVPGVPLYLGGVLDTGVASNPKNLAVSKILCEKLNNELSELDDEAIRLASAIFDWIAAMAT